MLKPNFYITRLSNHKDWREFTVGKLEIGKKEKISNEFEKPPIMNSVT
jgi:hypothetical protein